MVFLTFHLLNLNLFFGIWGENPNDGLVHPQKEIIGFENAEEICIIPVSLVNTNLLCLIKSAD